MSRILVDSGIGYLEKIPSEWNIFRIKNAFKCEKNIVNDNWNNTQLLSLTTTGVKEKDVDNPNGKLPDSFAGYQYVEKNNIIMCLFDLDCSAVFSGISKYNGMISPAYKVLECKKIMNPDYAGYYFNYISFDRKYMHYSKNIRYTLNYDEFSSLPMVIPPLEEQKRIASYLDKQCKKINEIINDNNHEIELLEEYKMKILDTACLKGVDKHEFINISHYSIDKIPAGWKFQKTLGILNMPITDGPHSTPNLINDGIPFISADAIKDGKIDFSRKRGDISEEDYLEFSKKYIPKLHDIYMIKSGATTGKVGIVETTEKFTIWSPLAVYRVDEKKMNYKYLYYLLQTNFYQKQVQLSWSYGTQQNIGMRILEKLKVLVPSLSEQEKIVKEIDNKFDKLNKSIDYRRKIIEKLEEYKRSLIYERVTGKREV